ncbi:MAG: aminotransferase class V-fold PLP-dependent enzyme [Longimicrobiaceae bacterium]
MPLLPGGGGAVPLDGRPGGPEVGQMDAHTPHQELEDYRDEFPILASRTYLNSCSLGALSRRSMDYLAEFQELWNSLGASAWYQLWLGRLDELRGSVAALWGARLPEIALSPSVSAALSSVASAVDYRERSKVVVAELDFPTQIYQWMARPGIEVVRVPSDDGVGVPAGRWAEYVDQRTAVVATSHVFYSSGYIQDLPLIAETARANGALFVVDGYQAAGQLPVIPAATGADVYLAGPLKWLLGGPGMAFMWVRQDLIRRLTPTVASWFGAADQFDFRVDRFELRPDARRFELGTPALPTCYTALGGLEIVREVGGERIRARNRALTDLLVERLGAAGFPPRAVGREHRSAIVTVPVADAAGVVARLAELGIIVDRRGDLVRVSPHFYNSVEDLERFVEGLAGG